MQLTVKEQTKDNAADVQHLLATQGAASANRLSDQVNHSFIKPIHRGEDIMSSAFKNADFQVTAITVGDEVRCLEGDLLTIGMRYTALARQIYSSSGRSI